MGFRQQVRRGLNLVVGQQAEGLKLAAINLPLALVGGVAEVSRVAGLPSSLAFVGS
jgi:hypothetical protein